MKPIAFPPGAVRDWQSVERATRGILQESGASEAKQREILSRMERHYYPWLLLRIELDWYDRRHRG
jgi:hypothetical protein